MHANKTLPKVNFKMPQNTTKLKLTDVNYELLGFWVEKFQLLSRSEQTDLVNVLYTLSSLNKIDDGTKDPFYILVNLLIILNYRENFILVEDKNHEDPHS